MQYFSRFRKLANWVINWLTKPYPVTLTEFFNWLIDSDSSSPVTLASKGFISQLASFGKNNNYFQKKLTKVTKSSKNKPFSLVTSKKQVTFVRESSQNKRRTGQLLSDSTLAAVGGCAS